MLNYIFGDMEVEVEIERDPASCDVRVKAQAEDKDGVYFLHFKYANGTLTEQVLRRDILQRVRAIKEDKINNKNNTKRKKEHTMSHQEEFKHITEHMYDTYCKKNADYGNSFGDSFQELGIISAITRMSDKMNRLKTLAINPVAQVKDESIEDTLLDLANYAVMTLIELNIKKAHDKKETLEKEVDDAAKPSCEGTIDHFKEARKLNVIDLPEAMVDQLSFYAKEALISYVDSQKDRPKADTILLHDLSKNIVQYIVYLDLNEDDMRGEDIIKMYAEIVRLRDIMAVEIEHVYGA